jgi:hypothetical protein
MILTQRYAKPKVDPMTKWLEAKPKILEYLDEGWSINVAFKRAGIDPSGPIQMNYYRTDVEFKAIVQSYRKHRRGVHWETDRAVDAAMGEREG